MKTLTYTRKELNKLNASDFADNSIVTIIDSKTKDPIYFVNLVKGQFKTFGLKSEVRDSNYRYLDCTPGVRGGRPYYIHEFINR